MNVSNILIWAFLFVCIAGGIAFFYVMFLDMKEHKKMLSGLWKDVRDDKEKASRKLFISILTSREQQEPK